MGSSNNPVPLQDHLYRVFSLVRSGYITLAGFCAMHRVVAGYAQGASHERYSGGCSRMSMCAPMQPLLAAALLGSKARPKVRESQPPSSA